MGRLKRYKKIKAFDPESKTRGVVDLTKGKTYDLPPKRSELDSIPSSLKHLLKATNRIQKNQQQKALQKNNGNDPTPNKHGRKLDHISALPGESMRSYAKRVKAEARKIRNAETLQQTHSLHGISEKRKDYLDRKKGKMTNNDDDDYGDDNGKDDDNGKENTNGTNNTTIKGPSGALRVTKDGKALSTTANSSHGPNVHDDDYEEPTFGHVIEDLFPKLAPGGGQKRRRDEPELIDDDAILDETGTTMIWKDNKGKIHKTQIKDEVKFGERVMEPPRFTVLPRLSAKQKQQQQQQHEQTNGKRRDLLAAQLLQTNKDRSDNIKNEGTKDRSDIVRSAQIDHARNEAIRAYQELKMRRKDGQGMAGLGTTTTTNNTAKPSNLLPYVSAASIHRTHVVPTSLSSSSSSGSTKTKDDEFGKITLDNFKEKVLNANHNNNRTGTATTISTASSSSHTTSLSSSSVLMGALKVAPRPPM